MGKFRRGEAKAQRSEGFFSRKERKEREEVVSAAGTMNLSAVARSVRLPVEGSFAARSTSLRSLRSLRETQLIFFLRASASPCEPFGGTA